MASSSRGDPGAGMSEGRGTVGMGWAIETSRTAGGMVSGVVSRDGEDVWKNAFMTSVYCGNVSYVSCVQNFYGYSSNLPMGKETVLTSSSREGGLMLETLEVSLWPAFEDIDEEDEAEEEAASAERLLSSFLLLANQFETTCGLTTSFGIRETPFLSSWRRWLQAVAISTRRGRSGNGVWAKKFSSIRIRIGRNT